MHSLMSRLLLGLAGLGLLGVTALVHGQSALEQNMTPKAMAAYGYQLDFTVSNEKPREEWRQLQRVQLHITEEIPENLLRSMGCETDSDVDCEQLATAERGHRNKPLRKVTKLTYYVNEGEWTDGAKGIPAKFEQALAVTNSEESASGSNIRVNLAPPRRVQLPDPACVPPYANPCYARPVCVQYGGCSKVTTSCKPCSYP